MYYVLMFENTSCLRVFSLFFFLMIRRPPRSTLDRSSAASDVYKRQKGLYAKSEQPLTINGVHLSPYGNHQLAEAVDKTPVSYTHLRAHETVLDLVCRLLLEKKKTTLFYNLLIIA